MSHDDLITRLRNTPNWQRESFEHWKDATCVYDRAPFEAADAIAALVAERDECNERRIETIAMCYQLSVERDAAVAAAEKQKGYRQRKQLKVASVFDFRGQIQL